MDALTNAYPQIPQLHNELLWSIKTVVQRPACLGLPFTDTALASSSRLRAASARTVWPGWPPRSWLDREVSSGK